MSDGFTLLWVYVELLSVTEYNMLKKHNKFCHCYGAEMDNFT